MKTNHIRMLDISSVEIQPLKSTVSVLFLEMKKNRASMIESQIKTEQQQQKKTLVRLSEFG